MKEGMSSFDVLAIVKELQILKDARINKIFQISPTELKIQVSIKDIGRGDLVIEAGRRLHLTEYPKPSPEKPSTFAMTLRKYIENGVIQEIAQVAFDRIIEIKIERGRIFFLIAELFGRGNVILADEQRAIIAVMKTERYKDRELVIRTKYLPPPQRVNPFEASKEDIKKAINGSSMDIVRTLALSFGLGGVYAEEVCQISDIAKNKTGIDDAEVSSIFEALQNLKNSVGKEGAIIFENENPVDVLPSMLKFYEGKKFEKFDSFNRAVDEYFTKYEIKKVDEAKEEKFEKELGTLKLRLSEQKEALEKFTKAERDYKSKGDIIYQNFKSVENILKSIVAARKSLDWKEIAKKLGEGREKIPEARAVKKLLPKEGGILVLLDGIEVRLDIKKSITENADFYYSEGKKIREKISGAEEAIRGTEAKIKEIEEKGKEAVKIEVKQPVKKKIRKREWYEKFRWFISSDGFLVIGGRDATSNEILVKKHMTKGDVFVHADIHGAPAVVIKTEGKPVPEQTIQEAFDFAAAYSKAWKHGVSALDVYWVTPEQVSKTTEHGEYVAKGGFIIRGKKNFGSGKAGISVGIKIDGEARAIGGPPSAIEKYSEYSVKIAPGRMKSREIADEIKKRFLGKAREEFKERIRSVDLEDIQDFLPTGGSEIIEK